MKFSERYINVLAKTAEQKNELTKMYVSATKDSLTAKLCEKDLKKLPLILARFYLDHLSDAFAECESLSEGEQYEFANEIDLYMKYQDILGGDKLAEIDWGELPEEALLDFVNY